MPMIEFKYLNTLKDLSLWIQWTLELDKKNRLTKVPYSPKYHGHASSTDPTTWGTYNQAVQMIESNPFFYKGLGLIISKDHNLVFIDIDHCIDPDENLSEIAMDITGRFPLSYMERSQSGTGIHIITEGTIPRSFKNSKLNVEMYSSGRFCALTGDVLSGSEPVCEQSSLDYVYEKYKTRKKAVKRKEPPLSTSGRPDDWIIGQASKRGRFTQLYTGDWSSAGYKSQSEADIALCLILSFWCDCDPIQIDRLFRSSGLYRSKWDRHDYRDRTIETAIGQCRETLSEYIKRQNMKRGERFDIELSEAWDH